MRSVTSLFVLGCLIATTSLQAETPLREVIDARIEAAWKVEKITPVSLSTDSAFLRRVYLDLVGVIPTYEETIAFLEDKDSNKRQKLIDKLLADPRFAEHEAVYWDQVFFANANPSYFRVRDGFKKWMTKQFVDNRPYNKWVEDLLKAEGNSVENGAPLFLAQYDNNPLDAAVTTTRLFLGMQLQCARCHDHPYEDFTQLDFYGMAAFFARMDAVRLKTEKSGEIKFVIGERNKGELMFTGPAIDDKAGQKGKPVLAKFLRGEEVQEPELPEDLKEPRNFPDGKVPPKPKFSRKDKLAVWVTRDDNPYFSKAIANRMWSRLMGRGIVQPIDDLSDNNDPSHPKLLEEMAKQVVSHKFDLKWLVREITNSKTYQLASAGGTEEAMPLFYERSRVRPLTAQELFDCVKVSMNVEGMKKALQDEKRRSGLDREFDRVGGIIERTFGESTNINGEYQGNLFEFLFFNNEVYFSRLLTARDGSLLQEMVNVEQPLEERIEKLFLSMLMRKPTEAELKKYVAYCQDEKTQQERMTDVFWVVLSTAEFRFNH